MKTVICYDSPDDSRRLKIANILDDFGDRVQKSVFVAILDREKIARLVKRLNYIIDKEEDDIRIYSLCSECEKKAIYLGKAKPYSVPEYYIL